MTGDFNAQAHSWNSPKTWNWGEALLDLIDSHGLVPRNEGDLSTFESNAM